MKTTTFRAEALIAFFRRHRIATLDQLKGALGTTVAMTVFRKLREISYVSSCSHGGRFYTLPDLAPFDERGLWTFRGVLFSRFGSLIDTVEQFVEHAERGFLAAELAAELQIEVRKPLRKLVTMHRLTREDFCGQFVYCASDFSKRKEQMLHRRTYGTAEALPFSRDALAETSDDAKAAIILFLSTLDERQRRLYAGLESLRLGHGGDCRLAELTGLDVHTIAKGRTELLQRDVQFDRVRRPGGGRPSLEKKRLRLSRQSKN
ncbi:MAG: hypothetical protein H7831_15085 [Magnetococcus sp. WYHC-3]